MYFEKSNLLLRFQAALRSCGRGAFSCLFVLLAAVFVAAPAAARELYWSSLEVSALLDADGRLRISERQAMVFDGDWNGGERRFDLGIGQKIELHTVTRMDPATGERTDLVQGDLDAVDRYDWAGGETLRWRSRKPSDPPFQSQTIVYILEYSLSGVLYEQDGLYRLAHDFAFRDRDGVIERFVVGIELDPAWEPVVDLPDHLEEADLEPGESVVVTADFTYRGNGRPRAVLAQTPLALRLAAFSLALLAMVMLYLEFRRHEASRGRYDDSEAPEPMTEAWLTEHLLSWAPEEAGALWDHKIGAPEVAATLARLVSEGKLASSIEERKTWWRKRQVLRLELLVERPRLVVHERELVAKLFWGRRTETDTDAIRKKYRDRGLNLANVIRRPIRKKIRKRLKQWESKPTGKLPWILPLVYAALLGAEAVTRGESALVVLALHLLVGLVPICLGSLFLLPYRRWTRGLKLASMIFVVPALGIAAVTWGAALAADRNRIPDLLPGFFGILALALFPVAIVAAWLQIAKARDTAAVARERAQLGAVRRYFVAQLSRPQPALDDAWFPYLIAFGLDRQVSRWFTRFAGTSSSVGASLTDATLHSEARSHGGSATGSAATPRWTGGGGSFGGAGATAAWSAAAVGLGAGVATPSSSGSSGGSSGGGSSFSGGGGGGGW